MLEQPSQNDIDVYELPQQLQAPDNDSLEEVSTRQWFFVELGFIFKMEK